MNDLHTPLKPKLRVELLCAFVIGTLAFLLVLGPRILNPANIGWLSIGDPQQHYLGWAFFRQSPWSFPLGLNPNFGLELSNSIVYTDSNPLLAILFKLVGNWLPEPFQYTGIWLLLCFILQSFFAWRLVGLITTAPLVRLGGMLLFVFAPPFLWRMQGHFSLSGHFLVLAALYYALRPDHYQRLLAWPLLFMVATLTHAYFLPMIAAIWAADLLGKMLKKRQSLPRGAIEIGLVMAGILLCAWQAGYFSVKNGVAATGYGILRLNLLSLFDSVGSYTAGPTASWSYVLRDIPEGQGDYEGFNYLGLGTLLAIILAVPGYFNQRLTLTGLIRRYPFLFGALVALTLFAITNRIGFGSLEWALPLNDKLARLANVFRASGRIFWPVYYVIVLATLYFLVRGNGGKSVWAFVWLAAVVQIIDLNPFREGIRTRMMAPPESVWSTPLVAPFWDLAAQRYQKVRSTNPANERGEWGTFSNFSATHHLATDIVYLARMDQTALADAKAAIGERIARGVYERDTLYIVDSAQLPEIRKTLKPSDLLTFVNGLNVLAPNWNECPQCLAVQGVEQSTPQASRPKERAGTILSFGKDRKGEAYLLEGWSAAEAWGVWSNAKHVRLQIPASTGVRGISMKMDAFLSPASAVQQVGVTLNGIPAGVFQLRSITENVIEIEFSSKMRESIAAKGELEIALDLPNSVIPKEHGFNGDDRNLAIGLRTLTVY